MSEHPSRFLLILLLLFAAACAPQPEEDYSQLPTLAVLPSVTPSPLPQAAQPTPLPQEDTAAADAPQVAALPQTENTQPEDSPATPWAPPPELTPAPTPVIVQPAQPAVPDQVVIAFNPGTSPAQQQAYLQAIGGQALRVVDIGGQQIVTVSVPAGTAAQALPPSSVVALSEPDYYVTALYSAQPPDPFFQYQWALPYVNAPQAWPRLPDPLDMVTVAVIDSGICPGHIELQGRILPGWDFVAGDDVPRDPNGHGCAVAGVIAANHNSAGIVGIAPNSMIMPVRVLDETGSGSYSNVAAGLVWAADNGAQIANLSLGGPSPSTVLQLAVEYAQARGVLVVAAAGNEGTNTVLYPAAYPGVIAVGAVNENGQPASFSNRGTPARPLDIWAPGVDILTLHTGGGYMFVDGTSLASPYVAGAFALEMAFNNQPAAGGSLLWVQNAPRPTTRPVQTGPAHTALLNTDTPHLAWQGVPHGDYYRVQIATTNTFGPAALLQDVTLEELEYTAASLPDRAYFWRVQALSTANEAGPWSTVRSFRVDTTPPLPPVLRTPASAASVAVARPTLRWSPAATANLYHIQVAAADDFSDLLVDREQNVVAYTFPAPLPQDSYYWRVRARDAAGNWSEFSSVFSFNLNIMRTPAHNSASLNTRPPFRWAAYTGAVGYQFVLSTSPDLSSPLIVQDLAASARSFVPPEALPYAAYYWRVNVDTGEGFAQSPFVWKVIVTPSLPPRPLLAAPANAFLTNQPIVPLAWNPVSGVGEPFTYELAIARAANFVNLVLQTAVDGTAFITPELADGRYFWRVRALNYLGAPGPWSAPRNFTVDTIPPPVPLLSGPAAGAVSFNPRQPLIWRPAATARYYELRFGTDNPPERIFVVPRTSYTPPTPLPLGTYYWSVRAYDAAGNASEWSELRSYSIESSLVAQPYRHRYETTTPTLTWTRITWAAAYEVVISTSPGLLNPVYRNTEVPPDLLPQITTPPLDPGLYYWRVRAQRENGAWGPWSTVDSFFIDPP